MTAAKPQAPVEDVVTKVLEKVGVPTATQQAMAPDYTKLHEIALAFQTVRVHLVRQERVGFWSKSTTAVDAGTYYGVPVDKLVAGCAEWIYTQAGGGDYTVEVINPTKPEMLTRFKISVPGEPRKAAPLAAQEAQTMLANQSQVQTLASQLRMANPGMTEQQAQEAATKAVNENPLMAQLILGTESDDMAMQNSGMGMVGQIFGMMMLKDVMRENRDAQQPKPAEDPRLKLLEDELKEMRRDRERERAETAAEKARLETERKMDSMRAEFKAQMDAILSKLDKPAPTVDPGVAMIAQVLPTFNALNDRRASESAEAAKQQLEMMKALAESANKRDPNLEALLGHMVNTTKLAMEQQQLKMQEPVRHAEAMNSIISMAGGMMQVMHGMVMQQMQANQGNPFWEKLSSVTDQLPGIIMALANPEVEHGTLEVMGSDTVDERAASAEVQKMRAADAAMQAATQAPQMETKPAEPSLPAAPPPVETAPAEGLSPVETSSAAEVPAVEDGEELPEDPVERAKLILEALELDEKVLALLEKPEAVEVFNLFWADGASPAVLGEKLAALILSLPDVITVKGDDLARVARENLGWSSKRVARFVAGFDKHIQAAAAAAAAATPAA